jgi:hypothetical protein
MPPELSVMIRFAVSVPVVEGVNATRIVQLELGTMERPPVQVVPEAIEKSEGSAPVNEAGVAPKTRLAVPVFVTFTGWAALVVPTF